MILLKVITDCELRMHILFKQLFAPASRIWANCALNTFLIVHANYSNSVIDKKEKQMEMLWHRSANFAVKQKD